MTHFEIWILRHKNNPVHYQKIDITDLPVYMYDKAGYDVAIRVYDGEKKIYHLIHENEDIRTVKYVYESLCWAGKVKNF